MAWVFVSAAVLVVCSLPPLIVIAPPVPDVPPSVLFAAVATVPPEMVRPPLKVFTAESVSLPAPDFVNALVPLMIPEDATVAPEPIFHDWLAPSAIPLLIVVVPLASVLASTPPEPSVSVPVWIV